MKIQQSGTQIIIDWEQTEFNTNQLTVLTLGDFAILGLLINRFLSERIEVSSNEGDNEFPVIIGGNDQKDNSNAPVKFERDVEAGTVILDALIKHNEARADLYKD